jgi:hypothetical protein
MPEFDEARSALLDARTAAASAEDVLNAARAGLRRAEAARRQAHRTLPRDDPAHERLARDAEVARSKLDGATAEFDRARDLLDRAVDDFGAHSDPRTQVERLDDSFPILLFPARVETRFKTLASPAAAGHRHELWVRIFPDTCLVDTFEAELADVEVDAGRAYWKGIWRAGGVDVEERTAWAAIVGSHGSGRAGWIVDSYRPANEAERPVKAAESDVILVVATEAPLVSAERTALATYWRAHWLADGAAAAERAARAALEAAVGAARAAQLVRETRPFNLSDRPTPPRRKTQVTSSVSFVVLPAVTTKSSTWTQAPRVNLLPDRFVLIAEGDGERIERELRPVVTPLITGPDPFAPPGEALGADPANPEELAVPEELQWLSDFDRAVEVGLGFRLPLTEVQARRGFDRLTVLGVRLSADDQQGAAELESLLEHHRCGRSGFSILSQGTPTNNTEQQGSGFTRGDDPDASFDDRRLPTLVTPETDPRRKQDGQWLAELLGIDPVTMKHVRNAGGNDQRDARAMQTLMWPATLGYFLETMLAPPVEDGEDPPPGLVSDADIEHTRWFFSNYVSGRGAMPAIRIGSQPYGILPTTAFSRISWLGQRRTTLVTGRFKPESDYLRRLHGLLNRIEEDWLAMSRGVPAVPHGGDAHQALLGILGLHPASAEFHYRYAETRDHIFNHLNLLGLGAQIVRILLVAGMDVAAEQLLARLGADELHPAILDLFFLGDQGALLGDLIDDRPLSETEPIRPWTTDGRSYLCWLVDAARTSLDALRVQSGFVDSQPPRALLYLLARHALILGYDDAGRQLHRSAGFDPKVLARMKREPAFVHIDPTAAVSESRWHALYKHEPAISPGESWSVAAQIAHVLPVAEETRPLREQLEAVDMLERASTARLERVMAEHIDTCTYRFDAWRLGFARLQLEHMSAAGGNGHGNGDGARRGVYLGAYAWIEDLRPEQSALSPVQLDPELTAIFHPEADPPLTHDSSNGGHIHAPSLNHAVTAAVLRSGYLANASEQHPDASAVNLSSDRVRLALDVLEGIRQGQSLGALLGYRLERGLHDGYGTITVDRFISGLRRSFPLQADHLSSTSPPPRVAIDVLEARNVVDGLRLVQYLESSGQTSYPFGLSHLPKFADTIADERRAVEKEVAALRDVHDALGDLALAEGVHQAVQGNFDRASATLTTYTTGHHPPVPEVTRTPATGVTLTHRVGLHLRPGLAAPAVNPTPRTIAEPPINAWLGEMLPPLNEIACRMVWDDPVSGAQNALTVTMRDLGLQPLDLIELIRAQEEDEALTELDARVLLRALSQSAPRPDAAPEIRYLDSGGADFSVFEVAPLIRHLRSLMTAARPLIPGDAALPTEATKDADQALSADSGRVVAVKNISDTLAADATTFLTGLRQLLDDLPARRPDVITGIDGFIDQTVGLLERAARLGVPRTTWTFAVTWRQTRYAALVDAIRARVAAWDERRQRFRDLLDAYDALAPATPTDERFKLLQEAESVLSTTLQPLPAAPATLRAALDALEIAFVERRNDLRDVAEGAEPGLADLHAATAALLPLTQFDSEPFTLTKLEDEIIAFAGELAAAVASMRDEVTRRGAAAQEHLTAAAATADAPMRVKAVQDAAKALLGDGFLLVPEFRLASAHGAEWQQALAASPDLLTHLTDATANPRLPLPVDEWLTGVARVRAPLRHFEQASLLAEALGKKEPELTPLQLPHIPGEGWLALDFKPGQAIEGERLLYTAHYTVPFNPGARQCGLLLDEWTEVVPGSETSTGLTFYYDQPSSEAPQTMLLVTPATWNGTWQWSDLTGALDDTLRLAKLRAVEPDQIDQTDYARFLPATVMAATTRGISIAAVLAINNGIADFIRGGGG